MLLAAPAVPIKADPAGPVGAEPEAEVEAPVGAGAEEDISLLLLLRLWRYRCCVATRYEKRKRREGRRGELPYIGELTEITQRDERPRVTIRIFRM